MKRVIIKIVVLIGIFIAGVLLFSTFLNRRETANLGTMTSASCPVMYILENGTTVNAMYGNAQEMQAETMRDTLTLLPADRNLSIQIDPMDNVISDITYSVSSLSDGTLIENGRIKNMTTNDTLQEADFQVETPLLMDQEYSLNFEVNLDSGKKLYYYTRLVQRGSLDISSYISYAVNFCDACLQHELSDEQYDALEPDNTVSNSSYHSVDIHSSYSMIIWGNLNPTMVKRPVPTIREANDTTTSIELDYVISAVDEEENTEYYTVREFYRMRSNQGKIILLDFDRETTQLFDGENPAVSSSSLNLGIVGRDLSYMTNESEDIIAFVDNGELWSYNRGSNKFTQIFSFRMGTVDDQRTAYPQHQIRISSVSETGDVDYVVYGYMPGDTHEGSSGIAVYSYKAEQNVNRERIFVPVDQGYEYMDQGLSKLAYVSSDYLYVYLSETLYRINLSDGSAEIIKEGLKSDCFVVSDTQRNIAWMEEMDPNNSYTVTTLSLETDVRASVSAASGEKIRALGFINDDFIYGLARDTDIVTDVTGNTTFPMYRICIQDAAGQVKKEYQADGCFVTSIIRSDELLELERIALGETGYVPVTSDHIMNNAVSDEDSVTTKLNVDDRQGTQVFLMFNSTSRITNLLSLQSQIVLQDELLTCSLDVQPQKDCYLVYGYGSLQEITEDPAEAIQNADASVGVVLDDKQSYIWERGNMPSSVTLEIAAVPAGLLDAPMDESVVAGLIGEDFHVMNLTGCTLDEVYYQISAGYPVIAKTSAESSCIILGYDQYNVWIFDPATGGLQAVASDDATAIFAANGNIFISYHS